jgi:hypothetical protein
MEAMGNVADSWPAPFVERDVSPQEMGLRWKSQKRSPLTILQNIQETTITIVQENLDVINELQLLAEQQFAALVQSQVALITQLQAIKDNIRINHFKSRFTTVVSASRKTSRRETTNNSSEYGHRDSDLGCRHPGHGKGQQ